MVKMMSTVTAKIQIYVSDNQAKSLKITSNTYRKACNSTWEFGTAKLVHMYKKWFLHIPMTKAYQVLDSADVNNIVGIDLGINFLATTYDSQGKTNFYNGNRIKHKRGKFKATRKQLQMRQTSSARKKLKQMASRENRYVTDVNHQITEALHTFQCKNCQYQSNVDCIGAMNLHYKGIEHIGVVARGRGEVNRPYAPPYKGRRVLLVRTTG